MHDRAVQREALLRQEIEQLRAQLRLREQQLFGRKTETSTATTKATTPTDPGAPPRRPHGQKRGRPRPRRRDYSHLPAPLAAVENPRDACCCRRCGRPFALVSGPEDSTILEIEVRAH